nr:MAG TPA: hypothetical protein [Caudoviricetes sp.]
MLRLCVIHLALCNSSEGHITSFDLLDRRTFT